VPIAVRIHKTLELADDKFYVITCGKAGFKNTKRVSLFELSFSLFFSLFLRAV